MSDLPKSIGPYRVLRLIGSGGMGQIYECLTSGGAKVAVKTVLDEYRDSAHVRARFRSEIAASKLVRGPYVADYFDSDPDELWLAIRFYPWPSLREHVIERGPLSVDETASLALKVAEALLNIHAVGIVHRDVTPSNILYQNGDVLVVDYGISKEMTVGAGYGLTGAGLPPHSWHYASPEHMAGKPLEGASDFFSLGCVLAFAATGHHLLDDSRSPRHEAVPPPLQPLVRALTSTDPSRRPAYEEILRSAGLLLAADKNPPTGHMQRQAVAACSHASGHLEVFLSDLQPGRIRHRWYHAGIWSEWAYMLLPTRFTDQHAVHMAATSRISGNSELFLSLDDGTMLHRWYWEDSGWSDWAEFDHGAGPQAIAVSSAGADHLEVFTTNGEQISHRWHREPSGWTDWQPMSIPETHWPSATHRPGDYKAVRAVSAAGSTGGFEILEGNQVLKGSQITFAANQHLTVAFQAYQHLTVTFADGCTFVRVYSRREDRWSEWSQLVAGSTGHASAWVDGPSAGVGLCLTDGEETLFSEVAKHGDGRPFRDMEDIVVCPLASPSASKKVTGLASASQAFGVRDYIVLFADHSLTHLQYGKGSGDAVVELLPARTLPFPSSY
jgi:serine/threonine protein kinase